jgi:hypothetical protein
MLHKQWLSRNLKTRRPDSNEDLYHNRKAMRSPPIKIPSESNCKPGVEFLLEGSATSLPLALVDQRPKVLIHRAGKERFQCTREQTAIVGERRSPAQESRMRP